MKAETKKTASPKLLVAIIAVFLVVIAVLAAALLKSTEDDKPVYTAEEGGNVEEDRGMPLSTKYIVLSYPSALEDMVTVRYEDLEDGQQVIFTTDFTGEELELFRFSLSKSGTGGHQLGTLTDETAGELVVCVDVREYSNGNWKPDAYAKLIEMQERVNDIIVQFNADPRFVPNR